MDQNGTQIEPTLSQNATTESQWIQNGTKMEPTWSQMEPKRSQNEAEMNENGARISPPTTRLLRNLAQGRNSYIGESLYKPR